MKNRFFTMLLALCLALCVVPLSVAAVSEVEDNGSAATAQTLNLGDSVDGAISTEYCEDYYSVTLTESGRLTLDMTSYMRYYTLHLFNADGVELWGTSQEENSGLGFRRDVYDFDLITGTYYVRITGRQNPGSWTNSTGTYTLGASFASANATETEPNNNAAAANLLVLNQAVNGHIAMNDSVDFYKLSLAESGYLSLDMTAYMRYYTIVMYDANGNQVWYTDDNQWDGTSRHDVHAFHITNGVYYLKVLGHQYDGSWNNSTGTYTFKASLVSAKATETEPNNEIGKANAVGLYDTVRGQIALNDSVDFFTFTVPVDRDITIDMTSYMRYYCLFLYDSSSNCLWATEKNEFDHATGTRSDTYTITLTAGTYYIRVVGNQFDGSWNDSDGNYTFILNYIAPPVVKTSNVAVSGKNKLTWDAVEKAVKYRVYRSNAKNGSYKLIGTVTGTSYTDTTAQAEKTYYYKVTAVDAYNGTSKASAIVSRMCDLPRPVVTATSIAASGRNKLTWKAVDGAVKYQVYRSTKQNTGYIFQNTVTGTTWTDTTAKPGTKYFYKVVAVAANTNANSAKSAAVGRVCDCAQPVVKSINVAASGKIKLSWTKIQGAVKYRVSRSTAQNGTYKVIATVTTLNYTDTTAQAGVKYFYKVTAICSNTNGNSAPSAVIGRVCDLARPVVKTSNVAASGKIKVTWGAITGASKYQVYRSTSKTGTYNLVKTTTATSYTDTTAKAGTKYFYKVVAICGKNTNGNSAASTPVYRVCDCAKPTVSVKKNANNKPVLSWKSVTGAVSYKVYRSTSKNGSYTLVKTATGTSWTDTTAKKGTTYYYKVMAICSNTNGNSVYSNIVSIKP